MTRQRFDERLYAGDDASATYVKQGGTGGAFVWPALLRRLERLDAGHRA